MNIEDMSREEILAIPMDQNDAQAEDIGDYLKELLMTLWESGEGFDARRPFGKLGWEYDLKKAVMKAGLVDNDSEANDAVFAVIEAAFD